jgi:hypothetical protein
MTINIKDRGFSGRQGMKYEKAKEETRLQAAGCEATPDTPSLPARIIPFPVMRHTETETPPLQIDFQSQLDDFLRDMGYIE